DADGHTSDPRLRMDRDRHVALLGKHLSRRYRPRDTVRLVLSAGTALPADEGAQVWRLHPSHSAGQRVLPLDIDPGSRAYVSDEREPAGELRAVAGCGGLSLLAPSQSAC